MSEISIILPSYNGEEYLPEAIESILKQTFWNWELILVDDCSTDMTCEIMNEYANRDKRIKVIRNIHNQGVPESLNAGFRESSGTYLTWTSDDNQYLPDALQTMHDFLEKKQMEAMVCADMYIIDKNGDIVGTKEDFDLSKMGIYNTIGACFLYRRNVLLEIGKYDSDLMLVEDYDYWIRIFHKYGSIAHIKKKLYRYRIYDKALSSSKRKECIYQLARLREKHIEFIIDQFRKEPRILFQIYCETVLSKYSGPTIIKDIKNELPAILENPRRVLWDDNKGYIIWGAGKIGAYARKFLGEKATCFVDRNEKKVGNIILDIPVYPIDYIKNKQCDCHIIIAAGIDNIYEILCDLQEMEVRDPIIFQFLEYPNLYRD